MARNTLSPIMLSQTTLLTTQQMLYEVPVGEYTIVKEVVLCNTDPGYDVRVSIHFTEKDAPLDASNTVMKNVLVRSNETKVIRLSSVLHAEDQIICYATASNKVSVTLSGVEGEVQ